MHSTDVRIPILSAAIGAVMALAANWLAFRIKHLLLKLKLCLEPQPLVGDRVTARVFNGYIFPLNSVYAYISIDHQESDVLDPPAGAEAYVTKSGHLCVVREDRLCWSVASNPASVDIYAKERQSLDVVEFDRMHNWIQIPSESGWGTAGGKSRVFLKWKKYGATIKIISKDTDAKEFPVEIDPNNGTTPLALCKHKKH